MRALNSFASRGGVDARRLCARVARRGARRCADGAGAAVARAIADGALEGSRGATR